jgi:F-type H+-transporting ATPase subunit delta
LVDSLTKGKVTDEAATLIRRAITGSRRRRVSVVLEQFGKQVSEFALRLVATVTVAAAISASQLQRLEAVLAKSYGQSLKLNVEVDETILGGIKVQVAGEILDGSLSSRLTAAKLQLA